MITVAILINGQPLYTRSAVNMEETDKHGMTRYRLDDGSDIWHDPDFGAKALAKKMIESIQEVRK